MTIKVPSFAKSPHRHDKWVAVVAIDALPLAQSHYTETAISEIFALLTIRIFAWHEEIRLQSETRLRDRERQKTNRIFTTEGTEITDGIAERIRSE